MLLWGILVIIGLFVGITVLNYFSDSAKVKRMDALVEEYNQPTSLDNFEEEFDVIVIGGEPEGVAAAVSSARNGMNTLLIEEREELGGLMTYGMLNFIDLPEGDEDQIVSQGIFNEWHELIGEKNAFDLQVAKAGFQKLVDNESNLTLSVATEIITPIVTNKNVVEGVKLRNEYGEVLVKGKRFIDATQDADFAVLTGAPYFIGGADIGEEDRKMAVTLMIHLNDVDWSRISSKEIIEQFGDVEKSSSTSVFSNDLPVVAWGFEGLTKKYTPVVEETRLRGLNIVKSENNYYINALQLFGIDGLNDESIAKAIDRGKKETEHIVQYFRDNLTGFEDAKIASFPEELYIRETRHIETEYQLPMSDIWENRDHWDSIGYGGYPVDVQAQSVNDYGYVISNPIQYAIPFRSLVPKKVENLLVVGRSAGFSSVAAGSARIIPTGMTTGEAAGVATAISIEENTNFREMSSNKELIRQLRNSLDEQGALVKHFELEYPYKGEWFYPGIKELLNVGLLSGGYANDLSVEEDANKHMFLNMFINTIKRGNQQLYEEKKREINNLSVYYYEENEVLTRDLAAEIVGKVFIEDSDEATWAELKSNNLIDKTLEQKIKQNRILSKSEIYYLLGNLLLEIK
ncbi:glucose-inhibited division protein A [Bacillus solimangrovi]|uniref:Glucose-inhibited division protein A n=1 Tax=Bacillus solimangrovi TaxID=1305675 RepID=A0A1E5LCZ6_9BACI|nr:glucose-inhibited division protein A [Bacillus solimangrovi]